MSSSSPRQVMDGGGGGERYGEAQLEGEGYDQQWDEEEEDEWDDDPQDKRGGQLIMH